MMTPTKNVAQATIPQQRTLSDDLDKYISREATLMVEKYWKRLVIERQMQGDLTYELFQPKTSTFSTHALI